eukprot:NODE_1005_length_2716_cov_0.518151.p4 type:complete len:115 gc:universal NODE_1005_length_2716_cov_0.518151:1661-2005(+)
MTNFYKFAKIVVFLVIYIDLVTPDFEVTDLLPKPVQHQSRNSWSSELNSSIISPLSSTSNITAANLSLFYNNMNDFLNTPPVSPERLRRSELLNPNIQISVEQSSFDYQNDQFE